MNIEKSLNKSERLVRIGSITVDSGQVMICDPCYIDDHWKKEEFQDIRQYKHNDGTLLQYRVDFENYEQVIPKYGKTMNQIIEDNEVTEMPKPRSGNFSYAGACGETLSKKGYGEMLVHLGGSAIASRTLTGDGTYPVFAVVDKDGGAKGLFIRFD